jgi:diaminopimelate decarboxylase
VSPLPEPAPLAPGIAAAATAAADRYGTPCYLTDLAELDRRARELRSSFPKPWLALYSLKANPLPAVVERLAQRGLGANVVSRGEWDAARSAGLANSQITLEGIGKRDSDLRDAVVAAAAGVPLCWLTIESSEEAHALLRMAAAAGLGSAAPLEVLLRLNPGVDPDTHAGLRVGAAESKFGMAEAELRRLAWEITQAGAGVRLRGVHVHVGSQLQGASAWAVAAESACRLVAELAAAGIEMDTVDLGGGFPSASPSAPAPVRFREALEAALLARGTPLPARVAVEPGRYLVATSGWLVARVLHVRHRAGALQVVIDASFAELVRPALYGARHAVIALSPIPETTVAVPTRVEGSLCESTDTFGSHLLPPLRRGDLVVLEETGAYASSMFSYYNGRVQPPEALLHPDQTLELARESRPFRP